MTHLHLEGGLTELARTQKPQVFRRFINVSRSDTGALEVHHRKVDMVDWLVAGRGALPDGEGLPPLGVV